MKLLGQRKTVHINITWHCMMYIQHSVIREQSIGIKVKNTGLFQYFTIFLICMYSESLSFCLVFRREAAAYPLLSTQKLRTRW